MSGEDRSLRPRGVKVYPLADAAIVGPDRYAVMVRQTHDGAQVRMVHTEGVTYAVTDERPWTWNDFNPDCPAFTPRQLIDAAMRADIQPVDLADWCHCFGSRTASNFGQAYHWAVSE